jgi:hypothetical protein
VALEDPNLLLQAKLALLFGHSDMLRCIDRQPVDFQVSSEAIQYFSRDAITSPELDSVDLYVPPSGSRRKTTTYAKAEHDGQHAPPNKPPTPTEFMRKKRQTEDGKHVYKMRQAIAEAPFGIMKCAMGFRSFSHRGKDQTQGEWSLVTACFNLRKLFR